MQNMADILYIMGGGEGYAFVKVVPFVNFCIEKL